jgi:transketolase
VAETVLAGLTIEELQEKARKARIAVLNMTYDAGSGHPGGSFSMQDFLVSLYYNHMNMSPEMVNDPNRDVFILSKGHCAPGLYAILGEQGYYDKKEYRRLRRLGGLLQGHVDRKIPGIEMSTGSLGMGLGYANGVALAKRMNGNTGRAIVVLGDGELQEGNIWESAMTSPHYKLDNVWCIVDWNKVQIDGPCADVKGIDPVANKFRAFNWYVIEADGHNMEAIEAAYAEAKAQDGKGVPVCIVFDTKKGGGVDFMEGKADFHGRALKDDEMVEAMRQLGAEWSPKGGN